MIIYAGIGLLLGLAILTVYALIQLGRNNTLTFFLIPVALVSSIFSGYTMLALQGTPIDGIPEEQVEVIWVEVQKPHIYFNVRPVGELQPVYYRIPYTEDNAKKMQELAKAAGQGRPEKGKFKKADGDRKDQSKSFEIQFDNIERSPLPTKKSQLKRDGVDQRIINAIHDQPDNGENTARDHADPYIDNDAAQ
jgi:hypothetical protein